MKLQNLYPTKDSFGETLFSWPLEEGSSSSAVKPKLVEYDASATVLYTQETINNSGIIIIISFFIIYAPKNYKYSQRKYP